MHFQIRLGVINGVLTSPVHVHRLEYVGGLQRATGQVRTSAVVSKAEANWRETKRSEIKVRPGKVTKLRTGVSIVLQGDRVWLFEAIHVAQGG